MGKIKMFLENWWEKPTYSTQLDKFNWDWIEDYLLEHIDGGQLEIVTSDNDRVHDILKQSFYKNTEIVYLNSKEVDKWDRHTKKSDMLKEINHNSKVIMVVIDIKHPKRIKGNLDLDGYTFDTFKHLFGKFVRVNKGLKVTISYNKISSDPYNEPLSRSVVSIMLAKD